MLQCRSWSMTVEWCSSPLEETKAQVQRRCIPDIEKESHLYLYPSFFQRGGTLFNDYGSTSTLEHLSLIDTLHLKGGLPCLLLFYGGWLFPLMGFCPSHSSLLYILDVWCNGGGLDYSIHPCILVFHLSFWGRVFPMSFSPFIHFMRDYISFCTWVPNMA